MDFVRRFVVGSLEAAGGVVEEAEGDLHVLLPEETAARLRLAEECRLRTGGDGAEEPGRADARLGSPLLERLVEERLASPPLAVVALPAQLPRSLPDRHPALLNAVRTGAPEQTRTQMRYLNVDLRAVLQADEVRSALAPACLRLQDGARVSRLSLDGAYRVDQPSLAGEERARVEHALGGWLAGEGMDLLAGALEAVVRRARRDLERMAEYYAALDGEMARAVSRTRSAEERQRRIHKRGELAQDLEARKAQLRQRLAPRVKASVVAAVLVCTEVERFAIPVRRRSRTGEVHVLCRAADGVFEGPRCAVCAKETLAFYLCDERLHVLCAGCGREGRLDPARCPACTPARRQAPELVVDDATAALRLGGCATTRGT